MIFCHSSQALGRRLTVERRRAREPLLRVRTGAVRPPSGPTLDRALVLHGRLRPDGHVPVTCRGASNRLTATDTDFSLGRFGEAFRRQRLPCCGQKHWVEAEALTGLITACWMTFPRGPVQVVEAGLCRVQPAFCGVAGPVGA